MKKNNTIKLIEGGLIGAALGIAAGILLAPESGKKLRGDIKKKTAEFQAYIAPRFKKMKEIGEEGYDSIVKSAMTTFVKAKKLSETEKNEILKNAKKSWKHIAKHTLVLAFLLLGPIATFAAGPASVNLGSATNFVILSKAGISTTGTTIVNGDIGVSPAAATAVTGFALNLTAGSAFSTSPIVNGKVYAPNYANPTPANITTAVSDMQTAYTDAAGRTNPTATELGAGNIGGLTLAAGLYKWGTGVTIPTDVTLSGSANDVWIFQIAQNLNISSNKKVVLSGGAKAGNIFWVVAGQTTIGTGATMNGNILDQTAIVLNTGATLNGRALAQTAVTLDASTVTIAYASSAVVNPVVVTPPVTIPVVVNTSSGNGSSNSSSGNSSNPVAISNTASNSSNSAIYINPGLGQSIKALKMDLQTGSKNNDVTILQQFLISQNRGSSARALGLVGPTSYFGSLTREALAEYQAYSGIRPVQGYFGRITRQYINNNY